METAAISYYPSPTALKVHNDTTSLFKLVLGPVGAGKTSLTLMDVFFTALRQEPDWNNRRRTRWVMIRSTYPELKSTVIKTFEYWLGAMTRVVYDTPIRAKIEQTLADGTILDVEFIFLALEDDRAVAKLRSLEVTGAFISEMSETSNPIIEMLVSRIGRYPAVNIARGFKGATWRGIIAESNPPPMRSWIYDRFVKTPVEGWTLFRQPPAMIYDAANDVYNPNPEAENIANLQAGYGYYYDQIKGASEEYIKVYVLGEWGVHFDGRPVHRTFSQNEHVAPKPITAVPGPPIVAGIDFGLTPAVVFTQLVHGELDVLREIAPADVTLEDFINNYIVPCVQKEFRSAPVLFVGDPAGGQRSALANLNSFQMLQNAGLAAVPAYTNDISLRLAAVDYFLARRGGFRISPECPVLITGLSGGYRFKRRNAGDSTSDWKDTPEKNQYSHPADCLQYAALYHRGMSALAPQKNTRGLAPRKQFRYT